MQHTNIHLEVQIGCGGSPNSLLSNGYPSLFPSGWSGQIVKTDSLTPPSGKFYLHSQEQMNLYETIKTKMTIDDIS